MKTLKTVLILFLTTLTVVSCSKDDDNKTDQNLLVGKWQFDSRTLDGEPLELSECEKKGLYIFTEDELTGYTYEGEECEIEKIEVFNYVREGDKLIVENEEMTIEYTIEKLTKTTLVLGGNLGDSSFTATFIKL